MPSLETVIARAEASLNPRQRYARDVLRGRQAWSGADLRGNAKRYGASYYRQRLAAKRALFQAGGCLVYLRRERGRLVTAAPLCTDDFGLLWFDTLSGPLPATDLA